MSNNDFDNNQGCLSGLLQLFALNKIYKWAQEKFGFGNGCCGCIIGVVLLVVFVAMVFGILGDTDWTSFSF